EHPAEIRFENELELRIYALQRERTEPRRAERTVEAAPELVATRIPKRSLEAKLRQEQEDLERHAAREAKATEEARQQLRRARNVDYTRAPESPNPEIGMGRAAFLFSK